METVDVIRKRRSVRAFSDRPVSRELLESLVEAACWAPTASNVQAWRFCVADDPDLVRKLDMVSPGLSGKPPVIVVALSDRDYARAKGGAKAADEFAALDVAYACENLMLAAADAGLGTCAIKSYNDDAVRSLLDVPENLVVELLISLGYPDPAKAPRAPKRKPQEEVLRFNECASWGAEAETPGPGHPDQSVEKPAVRHVDEPVECDSSNSETDGKFADGSNADPKDGPTGAEPVKCDGWGTEAAGKPGESFGAEPDGAVASTSEHSMPSSREAAPKETFHPTLSAALAASSRVMAATEPSCAATTDAATASGHDLQLLAYMVTSAAGLRGEPAIYGPLRLIESSKRVALQTADAIRDTDPARAATLTNLAALIAERQNDCMTDEESFYAMLNEAAALLAKAL